MATRLDITQVGFLKAVPEPGGFTGHMTSFSQGQDGIQIVEAPSGHARLVRRDDTVVVPVGNIAWWSYKVVDCPDAEPDDKDSKRPRVSARAKP